MASRFWSLDAAELPSSERAVAGAADASSFEVPLQPRLVRAHGAEGSAVPGGVI